MKDKGILMTPANHEAIVEDRKGMTRRTSGLKEINAEPDRWAYWQTMYDSQKDIFEAVFEDTHDTPEMRQSRQSGQKVKFVQYPYAVGQRLYIKEPYYRYGKWVKNGQTKTGKQAWRFEASLLTPVFFKDTLPSNIIIAKNTFRCMSGWYKRLAMFMPKKFARTWLLVTDVKAPERGKDISEEDIIAEGVLLPQFHYRNTPEGTRSASYKVEWRKLLTSIYGVGAMEKWYWPIEFKRIEKK